MRITLKLLTMHCGDNMAYCRFSDRDSEAYVYGSGVALECCGCRITGPIFPDGKRYGSFSTTSRSKMIEHLNDHRRLDFAVPEFVFARLNQEIRDFGDEY